MKLATTSWILIFIEVLTQTQRVELITSTCELAPVFFFLEVEKWISPENVLKVMSKPN